MSSLAGAAPVVPLDSDPPPAGLDARWIVMQDGARLRAAVCPAAPQHARGSVLIAPGRTEFLEKYFETMRELAARGFAVFVLDHRGQGLSHREAGGGRGHIDYFSRYAGDFAAAVSAFPGALPRPWIGLGHSMGGLVLLDLLMDRRLDLAGAVLCAPMTGIAHVARWELTAAAILSRLGLAKAFVPGGGLRPPAPFARNRLTHDPARYQMFLDRLALAPDLALGAPTFGWTAASGAAMRRAARSDALAAIAAPLLILSAERDAVVRNATHVRLAARVPGARHRVIPGAAHEILIETDAVRAAFWTEFDSFTRALGL